MPDSKRAPDLLRYIGTAQCRTGNTAYYAVSENEEIIADREIEMPGMEEDMLIERITEAVVELNISTSVLSSNNSQKDKCTQKRQTDGAREQQIDLDGKGISEIYNSTDVNLARMDESITDVIGKSEFVETKESELVDKAGWIVRRISERGGIRMSVILLRLIYSDLILLM